MGLYINLWCDASYEKRRPKNGCYARVHELGPERGAARNGCAPPPVSAPPVRATVTVQQNACADELPHKNTTNTRVSDPQRKRRETDTRLSSVLALLARLGRALPPDPVRAADADARP